MFIDQLSSLLYPSDASSCRRRLRHGRPGRFPYCAVSNKIIYPSQTSVPIYAPCHSFPLEVFSQLPMKVCEHEPHESHPAENETKVNTYTNRSVDGGQRESPCRTTVASGHTIFQVKRTSRGPRKPRRLVSVLIHCSLALTVSFTSNKYSTTEFIRVVAKGPESLLSFG